MNCARCDKPIKGTSETIPIHSASGAAEVVVHPVHCPASRKQTAPDGPVR
ncbi:hypothetical protein [Streptomyces sp. SID8352]|nr:hypothetical protein [Streptomyces sp. SID8352]MYU22858.1 hypothetical protein [Streptomyces sp. SID8352]